MLKLIGKLVLVFGRWSMEGARPKEKKFVLLAVPHTSNWDLVNMLAFAYHFNIEPRWMGKHTLFRWPLGGFFRALGGIPVDRRNPNNMTRAMAETIQSAEEFALVIPPEGTRGWAENWKSGFYHIAQAANIPVAPSYLDYKRKVGGIAPVVYLTGNQRADMDKFREIYRNVQGKYPENFGPVRLRDEEVA